MLQGSRDGVVVRTLASHQCGPGSNPRPGVMVWVCCWFLFLLRGFFAGYSGSPPSSKTNTSKNTIRFGIQGPQVCLQSQDCLCVTLVKQRKSIYFIYVLQEHCLNNTMTRPGLKPGLLVNLEEFNMLTITPQCLISNNYSMWRTTVISRSHNIIIV